MVILKSIISPNTTPSHEKDGVVYADDTEKANVVNDLFRDQTSLEERNAVLPKIVPYPVEETLSSITLRPNEVEFIFKSLPVGKASGPDGISYRIIRDIAVEISLPVCSLFNQSLYNGEVPDCFKEAYVSSVFKGGDPTTVCNHRPISFLSNLDKSLERLVFKYLYNHFPCNNILSSFQSGFTPGDSTVNQPSYLYNTFYHALDSGIEVRVVFCDISRNQSTIISLDWFNNFRKYFHANSSPVDWFLGRPV